MTVRLRNLQRRHRIHPRKIISWASSALQALGLKRAEIGLLFVSDRRMKRLQQRYRGRETPTNVLAFPIDAKDPGDGRPHLLGDIVISVETAAKEARAQRRPLEGYLRVLLIHGIVHLSGLDHERSGGEARRMARVEQRLLRRTGPSGAGLLRSFKTD